MQDPTINYPGEEEREDNSSYFGDEDEDDGDLDWPEDL